LLVTAGPAGRLPDWAIWVWSFPRPAQKLWLGRLMVVRDKLENSGGLAWRRLEQDQLPELPCLGPALACGRGSMARPHARAPSSPWRYHLFRRACVAGRPPVDAGIHRLPCHIRFAGGVRQTRCLHDCVFIERSVRFWIRIFLSSEGRYFEEIVHRLDADFAHPFEQAELNSQGRDA